MSDTVIKVVKSLNNATSTLEKLARRLAINEKKKGNKSKASAKKKSRKRV
jgi:hypothetical protein